MTKLNTKKDKKHYVLISDKKAVGIYKKSILFYRNGIVVVKTKDGSVRMVTTDSQDTAFALIIGDEPNAPAVEFRESTLNQNWELLYGFLFDQENAMLFFW